MKKIFATVGLTVLALAISSAPAIAQANVSGSWTISIEGPQGPSEAHAVLEQDGATFTGTITIDPTQVDGAAITDGAIEGNTIRFLLEVDAQGAIFALEVTAEVDGDSMTGQMTVPDFGAFPFTAQRDQN